ncbi:MAG: Dabb family protein [Isosphaeraceae bacterium]
MLAHNVYFSMVDNSDVSKRALVGACKLYLSQQPGIVFFACGTLEPDLNRPVNDRDFDVALHVVFESRAAHDAYQEAPLHLQFMSENRPNWARVRVFDSVIEGATAG